MSEPVRFAELAPSPWPNGAGRKADIAAGPGWLVSFAWLERDAPFSDYTGWDRTITLLSGHGFVLGFAPPHLPLQVPVPLRPAGFDGGWPAACRLLAGPCLVVNVMSERARWRHSVAVGPAPAALPAVAGERIVLVLTGGCAAGGATAGPRDALRGSGAMTLQAEPGTRLAIFHIAPAG